MELIENLAESCPSERKYIKKRLLAYKINCYYYYYRVKSLDTVRKPLGNRVGLDQKKHAHLLWSMYAGACWTGVLKHEVEDFQATTINVARLWRDNLSCLGDLVLNFYMRLYTVSR